MYFGYKLSLIRPFLVEKEHLNRECSLKFLKCLPPQGEIPCFSRGIKFALAKSLLELADGDKTFDIRAILKKYGMICSMSLIVCFIGKTSDYCALD
jgi:hypothetical protein